ncbi:MAG TPA: cysteine--tRNA ligase [Acidimicrobiales bacterium]|nr:cysteine--tRNA ligase [Acidimicrobiales bacterium]
MLRLHDTATGQVEVLALRDPGVVSMYVCGPTVYDVPHVGHGRFALVFDVLRRYLEFQGLEVRHVSNITDIDDKIIARGKAEGRAPAEVALEFEQSWWEAIDALGVRRPTLAPKATEFVGQMVTMIEQLVGLGAAYETSDGVYLSVEGVPGYGLLARQSLDSLRSGARVEVDEEKRSPLDFVLWKKAKPGEPTWPSPWGPGRPGWHTECVVMSLDLLGDHFDLHGGGIDLAFPHHENERAQAVALGRGFARRWAHNGHVVVGQEKMSKSLGNFTSLTDLLASADSRAYRLLVLRAHYRSPLEVTARTMADAEEALGRFDALARRFALDPALASVTAAEAVSRGADEDALATFTARMDDDLVTPGALSGIFELVRAANAAADAGRHDQGSCLATTVAVLGGALGLTLAGRHTDIDGEAAALVAEREAARSRRDFTRADEVRRQLEGLGWSVEDTARGTELHRRPV